jgi:glutathione S-transferase
MLKLYGGLLTRAFVVEWYLIELGLSYEFIRLDMGRGEHLKPDFLAINPMGKLPAIVDNDFTLWESGAILLYLAQKHNQLPKSLQQQAEIYQWILFANATLINGLFIPENLKREYPRLLTPLNQKLEERPFLRGEFSVVDIAVGAVLAYIPILLRLDLSAFPPEIEASIQNLSIIDFDAYPGVKEYIKRLSSRTAFEQSTRALRAIAK